MSKTLLYILAAIVIAVAGLFYGVAKFSPLLVVWGAAVVLVAIIGTLSWVGHTLAKNPDKVAVMIARYVPRDEAADLLAAGRSVADKIEARLLVELERLKKI
jgi:hypothetical protein